MRKQALTDSAAIEAARWRPTGYTTEKRTPYGVAWYQESPALAIAYGGRRTNKAPKIQMNTPVDEILRREAAQLAARGDGAVAEQDQFAKIHLRSATGQRMFRQACRIRSQELARTSVTV
jgi:hypothetical protein